MPAPRKTETGTTSQLCKILSLFALFTIPFLSMQVSCRAHLGTFVFFAVWLTDRVGFFFFSMRLLVALKLFTGCGSRPSTRLW